MFKMSIQQVGFNASILFTFLLSFNVTFIQGQNDYFITKNQEWVIASPVIGQDVSKSEKCQSYIEFLQQVGQKADELWVNTQDKSALINHLRELFETVDRSFLNHLIDQILSDKQSLDLITEKSYKNVTGFLKIVLADGGKNSWKIRLHIWQEQEEKEFPHNHKWDLYSKVITGYLSQEVYEKSEESCSFEPSDFSTRYSVREPVSLMPIPSSGELPCPCRDDYELGVKRTYKDTVSLDVQSKDIIALGESYLMPYHLVHSINPGRGAISLVFTSRNTAENSEVFVPINMLETNLHRHAPSFTQDTLMAELLRAKDLINQLHIHPIYLPEVVDQNHGYKKSTLECFNWRRGILENPSHKKVIQLSKKAMQNFVVSAGQDGKLFVGANAVDNARDYLFVLFEGKMYASVKDFCQQSDELICHSSFTDYGPVASAGVLCFNGQNDVITIEAYSGHYTPSLSHMAIAKEYLNSIGINTDKAVLSAYQDRL